MEQLWKHLSSRINLKWTLPTGIDLWASPSLIVRSGARCQVLANPVSDEPSAWSTAQQLHITSNATSTSMRPARFQSPRVNWATRKWHETEAYFLHTLHPPQTPSSFGSNVSRYESRSIKNKTTMFKCHAGGRRDWEVMSWSSECQNISNKYF